MFIKKHIHGIIASALYITIVLLILFLFGFIIPYPLPEERGILIEFEGGSNSNAGASSPERYTNNTNNEVSSNVPTPVHTGYLTQDSEATPYMQPSETPVTNPATQNNTTAQPEPETPKVNSRLTGIGTGGLGGSGTGTGGSGTGGGNPGTGIGGNGTGNSGPGGGSKGKIPANPVKKVEPPREANLFGKVVLKIEVDKKGNVINTTIMQSDCTKCNPLAINAVKQWKYSEDSNYNIREGEVIIEFKQE